MIFEAADRARVRTDEKTAVLMAFSVVAHTKFTKRYEIQNFQQGSKEI